MTFTFNLEKKLPPLPSSSFKTLLNACQTDLLYLRDSIFHSFFFKFKRIFCSFKMQLGYVTLLLLIKEHLLRIYFSVSQALCQPFNHHPQPFSQHPLRKAPLWSPLYSLESLWRLRNFPWITGFMSGQDKVPAHLWDSRARLSTTLEQSCLLTSLNKGVFLSDECENNFKITYPSAHNCLSLPIAKIVMIFHMRTSSYSALFLMRFEPDFVPFMRLITLSWFNFLGM